MQQAGIDNASIPPPLGAKTDRKWLQATFNNLEHAVARYFSHAEEGLPAMEAKTDEQLAQELAMAEGAPPLGAPTGMPQARYGLTLALEAVNGPITCSFRDFAVSFLCSSAGAPSRCW